MKIAAVALVGALGLAASALSANAAPIVPSALGQQEVNIVQVAGGCSRGWHPNRWGRCVPHRYGYARPRAHRYAYRPYRYHPRWTSPSDHVANQLNRRELGRIYSGGGYYPGRPGWGY